MILRGRFGTWLLAAGAATGIALAGVALVERQSSVGDDLPPDVVAVVDGRPILRAEYERALRAVASDSDGLLSKADRRHVLDRLIDEQLLVQHGLELGLATRDRRVRADLSSAVIALVTARADDEAAEVTDAELRGFFDTHRDWFRTLPRLHVQQLFFRVGEGGDAAARRRATAALARWRAGEARADLADEADAFDVPLPDGPVPSPKLRDYLGPTVVRAVVEAGEGDLVGPLRSGNGYHLVHVIARERGAVPPYEQVREQVRAEHRRRMGEERLRSLLEARRAEVEVRVDPEVL
ncbi:MAG: peptidylprolyl isomerase [Myxococcota bacterium]